MLTFSEYVKLHGTIKIPVPEIRQSHNYDCGPACLHAICKYYGLDIDQKQLIKKCGTTPQGTHPDGIIKAAKDLGLNAKLYHDLTLNRLKKFIDQGKPAICEIQAWGDAHDYHKLNDGHYVIALGYDKENILFMDPSADCPRGRRGFIPQSEFIMRWHDRESNGKIYHHAIILVWKPSNPKEKDHLSKAVKID